MSYQTGTATNLADLLTQLFTFATGTPGWTQDQLNTGTGQAAIHKGNVYASMRWNTGTPLALGLYQALGYTGGNQPGTHPNDSGNGAVSSANATIAGARSVADIGNGPFPSYFFFTDTTTETYIHVVVEITTDVFRHFGFGTIEKIGDWTGGEYLYGHIHTSSSPTDTTNIALLEGLGQGSSRRQLPTMHVEALPGQAGAGKWMEVSGSNSAPGNDTAGNAQILGNGGFRSGPIARHFGFYSAGSTTGVIPTYPLLTFYRRLATTDAYALGFMKDIRGVNIRFINPKQEIVIGSDTWTFFPLSQKTASAIANRSYNSGICYRKLV